MVFGAEHYPGREASVDFILLLNGESPGFSTVPFLAAICGRSAIDYIRKVTDGVRCLTHLGIKSDGLKELKRHARHSKGRNPPKCLSYGAE